MELNRNNFENVEFDGATYGAMPVVVHLGGAAVDAVAVLMETPRGNVKQHVNAWPEAIGWLVCEGLKVRLAWQLVRHTMGLAEVMSLPSLEQMEREVGETDELQTRNNHQAIVIEKMQSAIADLIEDLETGGEIYSNDEARIARLQEVMP
jgi:hypothetical protein